MKKRINDSFIGITIAALGLTCGCSDDSSESNGGDAGLGSETSASETSGSDTASGGTSSGGTGTQGTTTQGEGITTSETDNCTEGVSIVCEGDNRVRMDPCADDTAQVLEECDGTCDRGSCVDCAARGVVCEEGDVYLIDSCNQLGDMVADCENGCSAGTCVAPECVATDDKECVGSLLFALNSCGDQTNIEDVCDDGCVNGACMGCVDAGETLCYGGNVYPVDSCGRTGDILEECAMSCTVSSTGDTTTAACSDVGCETTTDVECFRGDMYAVDSCGGITDDLVMNCHNGCDDDGCLPCVPAPDGVTCFEGDVYDTIGGCDAASVRAEAVKQDCEFGCLNGACTAQGECVPAGVVCSGDNVHSIDSCDVLGDLVETCGAGCQDGACIDEGDSGADSSSESSDTSGGSTSTNETTGGTTSSSDTSGDDASVPEVDAGSSSDESSSSDTALESDAGATSL